MSALPCIVCHKALEPVNNTTVNQPNGGTSFCTPGHYGSTAFDPMDGSILEINICDLCLVEAAKRDEVLILAHSGTVKHSSIWRA